MENGNWVLVISKIDDKNKYKIIYSDKGIVLIIETPMKTVVMSPGRVIVGMQNAELVFEHDNIVAGQKLVSRIIQDGKKLFKTRIGDMDVNYLPDIDRVLPEVDATTMDNIKKIYNALLSKIELKAMINEYFPLKD